MTARVLVTGAGGPSATSFMNAVSGDDVDLFAADIDAYAAGLYLVPPDRRWIVRPGGDPGFVDDLLARCIAAAIDVVVPTVDFELLPLATRRDEFESRGIRMLLANETTLRRCLDKWALVTTCGVACAVPRTEIVDGAFDLDAWPIPFLVKPRCGAGGRGVRIITGAATMADCQRDGTLVAQEYLQGLEFSIDILSTPDARVLAVVPRSRLKIDSGIAVAGRTLHDERLESLGASVANHLGVTYVANMQFREDAAGIPKLLDVNARFPGTMPLTVASGIDMPRIALDMAIGRPLPRCPLTFQDVAIVRTWQEHLVPIDDIMAMERDVRTRDAR